MIKIVKIILVALILVGLAVSQFGCNSASDEAEASENQVVTVQRGDLAIDITAVGNLLFSHEEELAFEVAGTVGEVLVEIGDSVEEEQALVKLDISEWEEQIDALERSLTTAERSLTTPLPSSTLHSRAFAMLCSTLPSNAIANLQVFHN